MEFDLQRTLEILQRTPTVLDALLRNVSGDWLDGRDGPGNWSPKEILSHLILCEKTDWTVRMERILSDDHLVPFDPIDMHAHLDWAARHDLDELLDEFGRLRGGSLSLLRQLPDTTDWERNGLHPVLGTVSLRELIAAWAAHDLAHTVQIARTMARQYADQVGPFRAFLGVLG